MGISVGCRMRVKLETRLSVAQRVTVKNNLFVLRMQLIEDLRGDRYNPEGNCPNCLYRLTPVEILGGFNQDPNDFTTGCPKCGCRFAPRVICFGEASRVELPFYCKVQVLDMLKGKGTWTPVGLLVNHPALFRSAIVHFGTLVAAFKEIGVKYLYNEIWDWREKVVPFLGRLPDKTIAQCAGISPQSVRRLRRKYGISRFSASEALEEVDRY